MRDPAALLKDLVRIDTTNPPGLECRLLSYLADILAEENIAFILQETAPGRGNLLAWQPAADRPEDGTAKPPLILLSHVDVVAARAEQWLYPPFAAEEADGYIYGRGTVDTKQLTVMELEAFLALKEAGIPLKRDVYFLATSDEESGSEWGLKWFLSHEIVVDGRRQTGRGLFTDSDVISEGGGFPIVAGGRKFYLCESGQKSCGTVEFTVKARLAKGPFFGSGDGMARAMGLVRDIGSRRLEGSVLATVERFEKALAGAELTPMMEKILTAMKHNTMTVTMVAGRSVNEVKVMCDVRLLPGFGRDYLESILNDLSRKWDCEYTIVSLGQGYESNPEGELLTILEQATSAALRQTEDAGVGSVPAQVSGAHGMDAPKEDGRARILPFVSMGSSDGHLLTDTGARVYGYSPVLSWDMTFDTAVSMVHGVNERIHRDSVAFGCRVLTEAVRRAAGEEE